MKYLAVTLLVLMGGVSQPSRARAQQPTDSALPVSGKGTTEGSAGGDRLLGIKGPALTGDRRPLYCLRKSDVVAVTFTFSPEYDQTVVIRPDGFLGLRDIDDVPAEGMTIAELKSFLSHAYGKILHDPVINIVLKEFDKPFFIAGGQVGRPGKYELRSRTTVAEGVAIAGGFTDQSKHSQVVLFHRLTDGVVESHILNMKTMLASRNLDEDLEVRPGDLLFVPQNRISKLRKYLPASTLSTFFTPAQF
jgi:polysaccharide export outer membrane protein